MSEHLKLTVENGIAHMEITRPKVLNALNVAISEEIGALLDQIAADKTIRVLVIGSAGNFAAGADVGEFIHFTPEQVRQSALCAACNKLYNLPIPSIAAIEGFALGGGLELALACDLRVMAAGAKVGLPEIRLGIIPGAGGAARLPRLIGEARAKELIYLGRNLSADKALEVGLCNEIAEDGGAIAKALELAGKIAEKSAPAITVAKAAIQKSLSESDTTQAVEVSKEIYSHLMGTPDQLEGMQAFVEKRKPVFQALRP